MAVGSLRLDRLSGPMAALLKETGVETVSLAPEAGSQRLRDVIRKGITEEEIFSAVDNLLEYDMVQAQTLLHGGSPDGDGRGYRCHRPSGQGDGAPGPPLLGREERVPASDAQHQPVHPEARAPRSNGTRWRIRPSSSGGSGGSPTACAGEKAVSVTHDLPKWNYIQALLSLGDRRVGKLLLAVHRRGGNWAQAFREVNVNPDFYVYRRKETEEILPWDFIDHGVEKTAARRANTGRHCPGHRLVMANRRSPINH